VNARTLLQVSKYLQKLINTINLMRNIVSKNVRRQKAVMSLNTKLAQQQAVASSTKP
jgi:hypothetical protein